MDIPHTVTARPDTGLYNAKLAIWLFLASEVMLFGGLFSAYVFLRMGADDGYWPHGLLNVPVGTLNTVILIASSITVVLAWASLKMRQWARYKTYLGATILLGAVFLTIKLAYEYPAKFVHFGAFIKKDKWEQYEAYLGNEHLAKAGLAPRPEITGHLEAVEVSGSKEAIEAFATEHDLVAEAAKESKEPSFTVHAQDEKEGVAPRIAEKLVKLPGVKALAFEVKLDEVNADPTNPVFDKPTFIPHGLSEKTATIHAEDIDNNGGAWSAFFPKHSSYFAVYYLITGLHGLHILGGLIVFTYFFFFGEKLYRQNPEHMANRIEVSGLYWHFVDLVWIFVFPVFYLL
jgi:cytochrome c oxidase subunit 3